MTEQLCNYRQQTVSSANVDNEDEEEEEEYEEEDDDDEKEMNDNFEEDEENADDVSDEEEEEDEPDFMDNSGKCWEFASKIVDEKHLKEWCQNKMGGIIVGKEEKLTRQFHCQIKECQFKAIFLKSCSIIYTRNKHNHQMKNAKNIRKSEERTNSPSTHDYVDCYGKLWNFHSYIGKNISPEKMLNNYSLSGIIKYQKTVNFKCQKNNREGGRCKFAGIYLKSNGCLYTRGKHGHEHIEKNPKPSIGDDFVDNYGRLWSFHAHIDKNISQDKLLRKFGFTRIRHNNATTLNLKCEKAMNNGRKCPFVGIYLKSNGCLYTRGEHEHSKRGKTPQNIGDNYIDIFGKIWKFNKEIGKDIQHEELSNKFGFGLIQAIVKGLNLYCVRKGPTGKCKFNGVYLKSNGCLYTRGEHNHAHIEKNPKPNIGDNYVDRFNKLWNFRAQIGKDISNDKLLIEFGFTNIKRNEKTLNLFCQKINFTGKKCPMKGIYLKSNGCLYTSGEHVHEKRERTPQNNGEDYVDHLGNVWSFHSKIGKNVPNGIWLSKFGFSSIKYNQSTLYLYCQRQKTNGEKCPFKGIYLDSNGCLYIRGKHEHK